MERDGIRWELPMDGAPSEVVMIEGAQSARVNTQYGVILPLGQHSADCEQVTTIGGRCDCALWSTYAERAQEIVDAARRALDELRRDEDATRDRLDAVADTIDLDAVPGTCPICGTVCYGDCTASASRS